MDERYLPSILSYAYQIQNCGWVVTSPNRSGPQKHILDFTICPVMMEYKFNFF